MLRDVLLSNIAIVLSAVCVEFFKCMKVKGAARAVRLRQGGADPLDLIINGLKREPFNSTYDGVYESVPDSCWRHILKPEEFAHAYVTAYVASQLNSQNLPPSVRLDYAKRAQVMANEAATEFHAEQFAEYQSLHLTPALVKKESEEFLERLYSQ
jgi:hypothetical protein